MSGHQDWDTKKEQEVFDDHYNRLARKTDRMFAGLFLFQWFLGISLAFLISPLTWTGNDSSIHIHVYAAIFLGGIAAALPIFLVVTAPGQILNRYVIAISQITFSILLIHLTGGRIETHFHIFGSLAFLAFYRDFRPVLLATILTAADHLLRGIYWPESVYGVLSSTPLRALEHAAWVIFEDIFLFIAMKNGRDELKTLARHQVRVESTLANVEKLVEDRTFELKESQKLVNEQQQVLVASAKMSALGEMAGGVAHEINNPIATIILRARHISILAEKAKNDPSTFGNHVEKILDYATIIGSTGNRIASIVSGLRTFSRSGDADPFQIVLLTKIVQDSLALCSSSMVSNAIDIDQSIDDSLAIECRPVQISQVLVNLLGNAAYELKQLADQAKKITLNVYRAGQDAVIEIIDNGRGIPQEVIEKIMQPFFTTKPVGEGTGLGLSISKGIIDSHKGTIEVNSKPGETRFTIRIPAAKQEIIKEIV